MRVLKRLAGELYWQFRSLFNGRMAARRCLLHSFAQAPKVRQIALARNVLIDGTFDNEGYFWRIFLLIRGLGLDPGVRLVGFLGSVRGRRCKSVLKTLGVGVFSRVDTAAGRRKAQSAARKMLPQLHSAENVLNAKLPYELPGTILYDHILKVNRIASVETGADIAGPLIDILQAIGEAEELLQRHDPDLILLSHSITPIGAALAWLGLLGGRNVIVAFGNYGTPRYWRIASTAQFHDFIDRPSYAALQDLDETRRARLERIGADYLNARFQGATNDIAAAYAYGAALDNRAMDLRQQLKWPADVPVVAVYAANWFDYPHAVGMANFRDLADWIDVTLDMAIANSQVNWLFRPHPVDEWYGGISLADRMPVDLPPHVRLCPSAVNGNSVMQQVDGLITMHGTAAIEFGSLGKPVLVADRGWYHDHPFVRLAASRQDYQQLLSGVWWNKMDRDDASRSAKEFAGAYFGVPSWQQGLCVPDDSAQHRIVPTLERLITEEAAYLDTETASVRAWYEAGVSHYHTFKMLQAEFYGLSNVD